MESREQVVQSWRTDEVLIQSSQNSRVSISKRKIEVHNRLRIDTQLIRNQLHNTRIVLTEYLALLLQLLTQQLSQHHRVQNRLQMVLFTRLKFVPLSTQVDCKVRHLQKRTVRFPQSACVFTLLLVDHPPSKNEITVEPSMPKSSSICRYAALIDSLAGKLRDRVHLKTRTISMCSDDFESSVAGVEVTSHRESNNSSVISGKEVLASRFQTPVLYLMKFCETLSGELLLAPINSVVR